MSQPKRACVVGGGLAGLAAAVALADAGLEVELFEARRRLGGRASSFRDPATGQLVDFCQHVSLGCCTNLADFCRRLGIADCFRRFPTLHFIGPDGRRHDLAASRALPAPLHLAPALLRLNYLSLAERLGIGRALWRLARNQNRDDPSGPTMGQWLRDHGQSPRAIEQFWAVVLVSALGESIERVSVAAAHKVMVDGFMATRTGYEVLVPAVPLGELYGERLEARLAELGVAVHLGTPVDAVTGDSAQAVGIRLADGTELKFDYVIVAVPWRRAGGLLPPPMLAAVPAIRDAARIESSSITGVHLWFDRPITNLPHAVLVGRTSQWLFARGRQEVPRAALKTGQGATGSDQGDTAGSPSSAESREMRYEGHYYQVVISASRELAGQDRDSIIEDIRRELAEVFPDAHEARLLGTQVVTEKEAVFSVMPGASRLRPPQRTPIANLMLAGDWTATGWPATMESAIRSGRLAAQAVLGAEGRPASLLVPDLRRGWLAKMLFGGTAGPASGVR